MAQLKACQEFGYFLFHTGLNILNVRKLSRISSTTTRHANMKFNMYFPLLPDVCLLPCSLLSEYELALEWIERNLSFLEPSGFIGQYAMLFK